MEQLKDFAFRQVQREPISKKRDILKTLIQHATYPQQLDVLQQLSTPASKPYYKGPISPPLKFPDMFNPQYTNMVGWYFLVGNLFNPTNNDRYAFVSVLTTRPLCAPRFLNPNETPRDTTLISLVLTLVTPTGTIHMNNRTFSANDLIIRDKPFQINIPQILQWISQTTASDTIFPMTVAMHDQDNNNSIALSLTQNQKIMLQGKKGLLGSSLAGVGWNYYSFTNLPATGMLNIGGSTSIPVQGTCWLDIQFGGTGNMRTPIQQLSSALSIFKPTYPRQQGWIWFAAQMNNNTQMTGSFMVMGNADGNIIQNCRYTDGYVMIQNEQGETEYITANKSANNPTLIFSIPQWYTSPLTQTIYAGALRVTVPSRDTDLLITPFRQDQFHFFPGGLEFQEAGSNIVGQLLGKDVSGVGWLENVNFMNQKQLVQKLLTQAGMDSSAIDEPMIQLFLNGPSNRNWWVGFNTFLLIWFVLVFIIMLVYLLRHHKRS